MAKETDQAKNIVDMRRRAEEAMRGQALDLTDLSVDDIRQLVHELQIHQIELDMQNEDLRMTQQQLAESRDKYIDLYDFAPVGYFTVSEKGLILEANLSAAQLLGLDRNTLLNQPISHFISADSQDQFYLHCRQVLETKTRQTCELKLLKFDDTWFYAQLESIVDDDEAGKFDRFRTAVTDITDRKQAEESLHQQEKMATVGQLAGGIAHDFNNILTSIIGFVELTIHHYSELPPEVVTRNLQRVNQQAQRAARLVRQLLDFSRRSINEQHPEDLTLFMEELLKLLKRTLPENIQLHLNYALGEYWVVADSSQLQQVIINLAINARDAMPDGGVLSFTMNREQVVHGASPPLPEMLPGKWIVMRTSDTGVGIPEDVLPHVLEPFFTSKPVGEGSGLGLAQVYGIVKQHQGHIKIASKVGQGTTVTLYFPCLSPPVERPIDPATKPISYAAGNGEAILLVEDEAQVLNAVQAILEDLGYRVLAATDGPEALELYAQHRNEIALVLTDITMPEMDGMTLAQALRTKDPTLKIIVMTGYLLEAKAKELLAQGIVGHLQKPLNMEQLAGMVSRALNAPIVGV